MIKVIKRNGQKVDFDSKKIEEAIKGAFTEIETIETSNLESKKMSDKVVNEINNYYKEEIAIEQIQDCVEKTLYDNKFYNVGRAYVTYRNNRSKARNGEFSVLSTYYDEEFEKLFRFLKEKYPKEIFDIDGIGKQLDVNNFSKQFFETKSTTADVSSDAGSNVIGLDVIAYQNELPKPQFRINSYYMIWKSIKETYGLKKANEIVERQLSGDIYINDFHGVGGGLPYCYNYTTYDVMTKGLPMVKKIKSKPPKYLYAFKSQLEQFVVLASNSTLGACGLADILVVMSYYVNNILETGNDAHFDLFGMDLAMTLNDSQKELYSVEYQKFLNRLKNSDRFSDIKDKPNLEEFIKSKDFFENMDSKQEKKYRNLRKQMIKKVILSFDNNQRELYERNIWKYVKENLVSFIYTINQPMRGNQSPFTNISLYDDNFLEGMKDDYVFVDGSVANLDIVRKLQEVFIDTMIEELRRTPITFPVQTACFSVDEDGNILDENFLNFISKKNLEFGQVNIYCGDSATLSSCCRLRSDKKNEYFNSFGSGSSKIGSLGVCTINLPRLSFKHKNDVQGMLEELKYLTEVCGIVNNEKRRLVKKRIDNGNHPLYEHGFIDINTQYSTTGINGFNEAIEIQGYDILTEEGTQLGLDIIKVINDVNDEMESNFSSPHSTEQIPSENVASKLASKDDILGFNAGYELYSNQFIPLITNTDMLNRINLQGVFDKHFSGGSIAHLNVETQLDDYRQLANLIKYCAKKGVIYFAINYNLQECENGHMSVGKAEVCNICGKEIINNYTRVVGFLTNTKNWSEVRRRVDYPNRQFYKGVE